jgi:hypothetical protein
MASNKNTPSVPKPALSGRRQSSLDWNVRQRPAITPRREYATLMERYGMLLARPLAGTFGPTNSGVAQ